MARPRYKARKRSYVHDQIVKPGDEFYYDGVPSRHWTPLNDEAKEQAEKIKPTGLARLEKKRQEERERREAAERRTRTLGKGHENDDDQEEEDLDADEDPKDDQEEDPSDQAGREPSEDEDEEDKPDPKEMTATQKSKAILDALSTLKHDDDAHWTQGGEPDLNVMKERLGFAVKRVEIKEVAPEFVRNPQQ